MSLLKHRGGILFVALSICFLAAINADAADPILIAERMGDGAQGLTNNASPVFLQMYRLDGTDLGAVSLPLGPERPTAPPYHLMDSGSGDSQGHLTRSVSGTFLAIPGYNATNGEPEIANSSCPPVLRTIGLFTTRGAIDTSRAYSMLSADNYRSVVSVNGGSFWAAGKPGLAYVSGDSVTPLLDVNFRCVNIFNGQLFCSKGGSTPGIYSIGSGLPTSTPVQPFIFLAMPGTAASPYAFQMNTAMNVCYIADEGTNAGIVKFTFGGGLWNSNYTLRVGGPFGARGLTVDWAQPGVPVVYATSAESSSNRVVRIVDTGATSPATVLGAAPRHTVFRGLDFLGLPAAWRYGSSGNWSVGGTTPWYNWSLCLANDINLQFQNVNSGAATLYLSVTNNTSLNRVSNLAFTSRGYGSGAGTGYTLRGNALNLSAGISSDTSLGQIVRLPLTLTADQTFECGPGDLILEGVLSGEVALSKAGTGTLLLNATNRFTGAVNVFSGTLVINGVLTNSQLNVVNATLGGTGIVSGPVIIQSGGTVAPGGTNAISTLTVRGAVNLLGTTAIEIRKTGTNAASDSLKGISTLTYGGTLEVNLLAGELGANDAFELFQANEYAGNFTLLNLPQLPFGLYWDVSGLNTSGTIRVGEITRPVLAPLMRQPDGTVLLTFSGLAGLTYQVWATGDFRWGWTVVGNGTFAPDGSGSFYDWLAQFYPDQRFYLISVP